MSQTLPWYAGARGRLLLFNLLVVGVTLAVSLVAITGFRHAGTIQEEAQAQTLADMNGSLALARDTANVATAAVRLSQVVGALEYQSESARLQQTQQALQQALTQLAAAPVARLQPALLSRIRERSQMLEQSITLLLQRGHQRHLQRNTMLSGLWQAQLLLNRINALASNAAFLPLRQQSESLLAVAIRSATPQAAVQQLTCPGKQRRFSAAASAEREPARGSDPLRHAAGCGAAAHLYFAGLVSPAAGGGAGTAAGALYPRSQRAGARCPGP